MEVFERLCLFTVARDCAFVALAMFVLMIGLSFAPQLALTLGAGIALANAGLLLARAARLSDRRLDCSEPWRVLAPYERPDRDEARRSAQEFFRRTLLVFAQGSAGVSSILAATGLLAGLASQKPKS
jgi:hypothetical protein